MGLPYLLFVVNPDSFAQTVENVFYLSFLVRENKCCIEWEEDESSEWRGEAIVCELTVFFFERERERYHTAPLRTYACW